MGNQPVRIWAEPADYDDEDGPGWYEAWPDPAVVREPSVAEVVEWLKQRVNLRAVVEEAVRLTFSDEEMTVGEMKDRVWAVVSDESS